MSTVGRQDLFENTPIPKAVRTLAIPTVIGCLVMVIYNLADTYFVGLLNSPVQTAAVTIVGPILLAYNAINNLFGVGCSSLMSRALGNGDYETMKKASSMGFYLSLLGGFLISLICLLFRTPLLQILGADATTMDASYDYLFYTVVLGAAPSILNVVQAYMVRSEGNALAASIGSMTGCILNMVLDPFFILPWGLNMGAAGAGFATMLSNLAACGFFFLYIQHEKGKTNISMKPCGFDGKTLKEILSVGLPASIQNLLNVCGMILLNNFASAYGATAVAAIGIATKLNNIPLMISLALSQSIMPLVGYNYSSGNRNRMKEAILYTTKISLVFLVGITILYVTFSKPLVSLFIADAEVIAYGAMFLNGMSLALPFLNLDFMSVGVFQAIGNGKISLFLAILRKIILEIPAILILNTLFPLNGLAYSQLCAEVIMGMVAIYHLRNVFDPKPKLES